MKEKNPNHYTGKRLSLLLRMFSMVEGTKKREFKIFCYLLPDLRKGTFITVSQVSVAAMTNLSPSQASKAFAKLLESGLIETDGQQRSRIRLTQCTEAELEQKIAELCGELDEEYEDEDDD